MKICDKNVAACALTALAIPAASAAVAGPPPADSTTTSHHLGIRVEDVALHAGHSYSDLGVTLVTPIFDRTELLWTIGGSNTGSHSDGFLYQAGLQHHEPLPFIPEGVQRKLGASSTVGVGAYFASEDNNGIGNQAWGFAADIGLEFQKGPFFGGASIGFGEFKVSTSHDSGPSNQPAPPDEASHGHWQTGNTARVWAGFNFSWRENHK